MCTRGGGIARQGPCASHVSRHHGGCRSGCDLTHATARLPRRLLRTPVGGATCLSHMRTCGTAVMTPRRGSGRGSGRAKGQYIHARRAKGGVSRSGEAECTSPLKIKIAPKKNLRIEPEGKTQRAQS